MLFYGWLLHVVCPINCTVSTMIASHDVEIMFPASKIGSHDPTRVGPGAGMELEPHPKGPICQMRKERHRKATTCRVLDTIVTTTIMCTPMAWTVIRINTI